MNSATMATVGGCQSVDVKVDLLMENGEGSCEVHGTEPRMNE